MWGSVTGGSYPLVEGLWPLQACGLSSNVDFLWGIRSAAFPFMHGLAAYGLHLGWLA